VFRRRRSAQADDELYEDEPFDDEEPAEAGPPAGAPRAEGGPWDVDEPYPVRERKDLGSLLVPVGPDCEIELTMAEQHGAWVTVRYGDSEMKVQAFAAPRRGALWDDLRAEIAAEVSAAGGRSEETTGSFGVEVVAQVPAQPGQPASGMFAARFVGVDGPRWLLRALITGPAASGGPAASVLEEAFRDMVVVRGEHPVPPRDLLELRLPPEAMKAYEEQAAAAEQNRFQTDLNPFDRGPEFTETR
jgi:Protein of unknown function (DUF3710)